jgi:oxalate decarboxylase
MFGASEDARTFDYRAGDVGYVPFAMGHYFENPGYEMLRFPRDVPQSAFVDVSFERVDGADPVEPVQGHLNLERAVSSSAF